MAQGKFVPLAQLFGHKDAVLCLAVNGEGEILASGGRDGACIWDMNSLKQVSSPAGTGHRGAVSAIIWAQQEDDSKEFLIYGTEKGWLVAWVKREDGFEEIFCVQIALPSEITSLAFDPPSARLVLCNRNGIVQSHIISGDFRLTTVFSSKITGFTPKAIAFGKNDADNRAIMVFGLYCGRVHVLNKKTGEIESTKDTGGMIGDVDVSDSRNTFLLDVPKEGAALYRLDGWVRTKTFPVPVKTDLRSRQVSLGEKDSIIVSGSDHGRVYVYGRRDGRQIDELILENSIWCQTVLAANIRGMSSIVACGSANINGPNPVCVWTRAAESEAPGKPKPKRKSKLIAILCVCLVLVVGVVFIVNLDRLMLQIFKTYLRLRGVEKNRDVLEMEPEEENEDYIIYL